MSWSDTSAVKTVIETVPALTTATFVVVVPAGTSPIVGPYVVIFPSDGISEATRFTGPPTTEHPDYTLHIVGSSVHQVQVLASLIKTEFVTDGFVIPPEVSGRRARSGYWSAPVPVQVDAAVTPNLVYQVIELGWTSDPA